MANKELKYGSEARKSLELGVDAVANVGFGQQPVGLALLKQTMNAGVKEEPPVF